MKKTLECSSAGDKRFSAFYATIKINNINKSIERIYQDCKYKANNDKCRKGEHVDYILLKDKKLSPEYLTPLYRLLWYIYLSENKELVEYAKQYEEFTDKFRGHCINCSADCVKAFVNKDKDFYRCIYKLTKLFKND